MASIMLVKHPYWPHVTGAILKLNPKIMKKFTKTVKDILSKPLLVMCLFIGIVYAVAFVAYLIKMIWL